MNEIDRIHQAAERLSEKTPPEKVWCDHRQNDLVHICDDSSASAGTWHWCPKCGAVRRNDHWTLPELPHDDLACQAAQCLDDCLVRFFPEEFREESREAAAQRFSDAGGSISRCANIADQLRNTTNIYDRPTEKVSS